SALLLSTILFSDDAFSHYISRSSRRLFRRKVSGFVNRLFGVAKIQNDAANDKENDQSENRGPIRICELRNQPKHDRPDPGGSSFGNCVNAKKRRFAAFWDHLRKQRA